MTGVQTCALPISIQVVCPGFVSDCLETLEEIAMEVKTAFLEEGGTHFDYIPCLNDSDAWVDAMHTIALSHMAGWPLQSASAQTRDASRQAALAMGASQ